MKKLPLQYLNGIGNDWADDYNEEMDGDYWNDLNNDNNTGDKTDYSSIINSGANTITSVTDLINVVNTDSGDDYNYNNGNYDSPYRGLPVYWETSTFGNVCIGLAAGIGLAGLLYLFKD